MGDVDAIIAGAETWRDNHTEHPPAGHGSCWQWIDTLLRENERQAEQLADTNDRIRTLGQTIRDECDVLVKTRIDVVRRSAMRIEAAVRQAERGES